MTEWLRANWFELLAAMLGFSVFLAIVTCAGCSMLNGGTMDEIDRIDLMETQASAPRFTYVDTNLPYVDVIVDNETGVQYLCRSKYGITPLLSSDGAPELVGEAGD